MELIENISKKRLSKLHYDPEKSAELIHLRYVNDEEKGISRMKKGSGFFYLLNGKKISDNETLARIKSLVLPPAWTDVWICKHPNGHLQATGKDAAGRKQYRYHNDWVKLRNQTKFSHLLDFGQRLPVIRKRVEEDLDAKELNQNKILALVVSLLETTTIRIGNSSYEKLYGSFGLTTLKNKHVDIDGARISFSFKGKKGVYHNIEIKSRKLANIIKKCREIPGKELFQYLDKEGNRHSVDSGLVNDYIKEISGGNFTAKDFRTWSGTVCALMRLGEAGCCESKTEAKRKIVEVLDFVAAQLGNTRAVSKKYYVHPLILDLYEANDLEHYFASFDAIVSTSQYDLKPEERLLMQILEKA